MDPAIKEMNIALLRYFHAERRGGVHFLLVGSVAAALALWFVLGDHPLRPAWGPLTAIGIVQIAVGASVFLRTESRLRALVRQLNSEPAAYREAEEARLDRVLRGFLALRWIEIAVAAAGLVLLLGGDRWVPGARGAGWGLLVQGVVTLALDGAAERRAADYRAALRRLGAT